MVVNDWLKLDDGTQYQLYISELSLVKSGRCYGSLVQKKNGEKYIDR